MKFREKTNIEDVKRTMCAFVNVMSHTSIKPFVHNMYTDTSFVYAGSDFLDIWDNMDALGRWANYMYGVIENQKDLLSLYTMVRSPYKLTWLKYCKSAMSLEDFSYYLGNSWVDEENPNQDANVTLRDAVSWFKAAYKESLMESDELSAYMNASDMDLWRGVSKGRAVFGLSWTDDKDKAEWFRDRFGDGMLLHLRVRVEHLLARLERRGEDEWVVNVYPYRKNINDQAFGKKVG